MAERDPRFDELLSRHGRGSAIAKALGISRQSVSKWQRIPEAHVQTIVDKLGIPAWQLRPDLFKKPKRAKG